MDAFGPFHHSSPVRCPLNQHQETATKVMILPATRHCLPVKMLEERIQPPKHCVSVMMLLVHS